MLQRLAPLAPEEKFDLIVATNILIYYDVFEQSLALVGRLKEQTRTRKRYADVLIAPQVIAGYHILVTRNTEDFQDLLPAQQLQNWMDEAIS